MIIIKIPKWQPPFRDWYQWMVRCAVASVLAASPASADDWPQWRGPRRDAVSHEQGLLTEWPAAGPAVQWHAVGMGRGYSTVAVAAGRVYTMGLRSGAKRASRSESQPASDDQPAASKDTNPEEPLPVVVSAWHESNGQAIWSQSIGTTLRTPCATPTWDGDRVYALDPDGKLACLDAESGKVLWSKRYVEDFGGEHMSHRGYGESPLIDGDHVIGTPGGPDAIMVALNKFTGEVIWKTRQVEFGPKGRDGAGFSSPVVSDAAGVHQIVQLIGRGLIGVDARDGRLLWHYNDIANETVNIPTPVVRDDWVFAANGYSAGSVLLKIVPAAAPADVTSAAGSGRELRAEPIYTLHSGQFQNHHGGMVLMGDHIYGGHGNNNGFPTCLELQTGHVRWKRRGPGEGSAAIAAAAGRLYLRYQDGNMTLIEPKLDDFEVKGQFTIPGAVEESWPHPVIANGLLYLREQDDLWVYNLRSPN